MTVPIITERIESVAELNRLRRDVNDLALVVQRAIVPFDPPDPSLNEDIIEDVTAGHVSDHETLHRLLNNGVLGATRIRTGHGSPEGTVVANPGSLFLNLNGGAGTTLYVKETLTGSTGWVGK